MIGLYDVGVLVADVPARAFKRITLGWSVYTIEDEQKEWAEILGLYRSELPSQD